MQSEFISALLDVRQSPLPFLKGSDEMRAARRFSVYRNNVVVGLVDALASTFPVVQALVGEEFFRAMGREFCRSRPPASPVLALYGDQLPTFIAGFAPASQLPYLADVARLEWLRAKALHAADEVPLAQEDITELVNLPASLLQSRWKFHASLSLMESDFSVVSLWAAHQHQSQDATDAALSELDWSHEESALIVRQGLDVMVMQIAPAEFTFVERLAAGFTLGEAVQTAQDKSPHFDLPLMFALLLRSGALAGFTFAA